MLLQSTKVLVDHKSILELQTIKENLEKKEIDAYFCMVKLVKLNHEDKELICEDPTRKDLVST